jgi:CO dehydrogenase nickel-insertion accessory protein CooC1
VLTIFDNRKFKHYNNFDDWSVSAYVLPGEVPMKRKHPLNGKRIGVFGKGGAGKSTFVVLLAQVLQKHGYRVCVLDADSTNYGLAQALGIEPPSKTLMELFGGMVFSGGKVTCPVDDPTPLQEPEIDLADLPPAYYARNSSGITLLTAGKIGEQGPGAGCDGPVAKIARDLVIREGAKKPVTLIDFKAGFEDSARGVLTNLDWAIVVVDPTLASLQIAADMRDMVNQIQNDVLPATAHLETPQLVAFANKLFTEARIKDVFFVINRVPDQETAAYLRKELGQKGLSPITALPEDPTIPSAWLRGEPLPLKDKLDKIEQVRDVLEKNAFDAPGQIK